MASDIINLNDYLPKLLECTKCSNSIWRIEISTIHKDTIDTTEKKPFAVSYSCAICDNRITDEQLHVGLMEVIKARRADVAETQ